MDLTRNWVATVFLGVLAASQAHACTACFGNPTDPQTKGMNAAIFTLLGVTGGLLLAAGGIVLHFAIQARKSPDT